MGLLQNSERLYRNVQQESRKHVGVTLKEGFIGGLLHYVCIEHFGAANELGFPCVEAAYMEQAALEPVLLCTWDWLLRRPIICERSGAQVSNLCLSTGIVSLSV